jgi:2'-5' RNA ligase
MERLFFAIWPDGEAATRLAGLARELAEATGGKPVPAAKVHITIAFLGSVAADRAASAREAGAAVRAAAFDLDLDRLGSFRGARVAWAGCDGVPAGLVRLHAALARELRARGFELEERDFTPHVTLARRIRRAVERRATEAIAWRTDALTLVRTEAGTGDYKVVERWNLEGP